MAIKSNVLLVDDHILFREGFASLLKGMANIGEVHHAGTEKEALSVLSQEKVDLIFMDIKLEESSGIDLTSKIRQQFLNIKIIALSMFSDRSNLLKMLAAGANGYLPKNTSFQEVSSAIEAVLRDENYFSASLLAIMKSSILSEKELATKYGAHEELSQREIQVLVLVCQSYNTPEIAKKLFIAPKTVEAHRASILSKLGAKNMIEVVIYAFDSGVLNTIVH